jgi:hypothetical protein
MLTVIKANLGGDPEQVLVDARYRSEAVFEQLSESTVELIVALGREGRQQLQIDAAQYPRTAAMHDKLQREAGQTAYRKTQVDRRAAQWLDQGRVGIPAIQHARHGEGARRVQTRVSGAQSASNGDDADKLSEQSSVNAPVHRFIKQPAQRPWARQQISHAHS